MWKEIWSNFKVNYFKITQDFFFLLFVFIFNSRLVVSVESFSLNSGQWM